MPFSSRLGKPETRSGARFRRVFPPPRRPVFFNVGNATEIAFQRENSASPVPVTPCFSHFLLASAGKEFHSRK
jgi:hypothetical protein